MRVYACNMEKAASFIRVNHGVRFLLVLTMFYTPTFAQYSQYSVLKFGATGLGVADDTKAIQAAIDKNEIVYFPKGTYLISSMRIGDNRKIVTDGYSVVFKQDNRSIGKQMIRIEGSNVSLDPMTCVGNIATDTSEFNIALFIVPPLDRNTKNITIKGLVGKDLRGDGVCVGTGGNNYPENVLVENIKVENCYRNGISVVSGKNVTIRNVDVNHSGMQGIDIEGEGEAPGAILENVVIENVKAGNLCISGAQIRAKNIKCTNIKLDGNRQLSTPRFRPMQNAGIILYNAEDVTISNLEIVNMPGFAIFAGDVYENDKVLCERITINNLLLKNNAQTDRVYNAYICVMGVHEIVFNKVNATLSKEHTLFYGKGTSFPGTQVVKIKKGTINGGKWVATKCTLLANDLTIQTGGNCFDQMHSITLENSKIISSGLNRSGVQASGTFKNPGGKIQLRNTFVNGKLNTNTGTDEFKWISN